jgi:exonuclease VII small subunit
MAITKIELINKQVKNLYKIVDKLEQRIATLEKVLESHTKCIGELRGTELRIHDLKENKLESKITNFILP